MAINSDFLHQLDRFGLVINKRITSNFIGQKRSTALGKGLIFKDHRIYAPGDDLRNLDWKVFARTDDLFIKNYEEERNLAVNIIMDSSASMDFGRDLKKYEYGGMLALGFAYLSLKGNQKVQFTNFADDIQVFKPTTGMALVGNMVRHINALQPQGKSEIDFTFKKIRHMIGNKTMTIVISDFLIPIEEIEAGLISLGKQELTVVQVLDPVEKKLKLEGEYDLEDSESGLKLKSFVSTRMRNDFQNKLDAHTNKVKELVEALGGKFFKFTSDVDVFDAFFEMLR
jgi:uncharacterized protein (DUF58 family)